jgi:hypothetical protein
VSHLRKAAWIAGTLAACVVLASQLGALVTAGAEGPPDNRTTGHDLAKALGLEPITEWPVTGCSYLAEAEEGVAYCLDAVASNEHDAWVLMERIRGSVPSVLEEQIYALEAELVALSGREDQEAVDRRAELTEQLLPLLIEEESAASGG